MKKIIEEIKNPNTNVIEIKNILLKSLYGLILFLGLPSIIIGVIEALHFQQYITAGFYIGIFLPFLVSVILFKKVSFNFKVINILLIIYSIALHNLIIWGISGAAIPFLILFCILTTVLIGINHGVFAVLLSVISMMITGFFMISGLIETSINVMTISVTPISWITAIIVMIFIGVINILGVGLIQYNLENSFKHQKKQSIELEKTNEILQNDIYKRKLLEEKLRHRILIDTLLNKISTKFIKVDFDKIDYEIAKSISEFGEINNFQNMFMAIFAQDMKSYISYFEYNKIEKFSSKNKILSMLPEEINWPIKSNAISEFFYLSKLDDLKIENEMKVVERKYCILPFVFHDKVIGIMGVRINYHQDILLNDFVTLKIFKDIFANTLLNRQTELEKVKIQQQLFQSQKLESIGNLSAGIAHDFNNLLTIILGNSELLKYKIDTENLENNKLLDDMIDASERAAALTKKMLIFSSKQEVEFHDLDINMVINDIMQLIKRLIGEEFHINLDLSEEVLQIFGDEHSIEQILMNLFINARDAMPDGGTINLKSQLVQNKSENSEKYEQIVRLIIEDNGEGIDNKIIDKIFDPFFTTKDVSKGTGLGLSVIYGIVKQHNGEINVKSKIGSGTSFTIDFPLSKNDIT